MIEISNVSMKYKLVGKNVKSFKELVISLMKGEAKIQEFWALKDISFHVDKGEVIGIVGHNGAGKSTLLKIISGILTPTEGTLVVNGSVVPMLELGSGFDHELTGRENIFLNGSILGYSKEFLGKKYNDIVDFSELDEFIDEPLRNYSSGMIMRLAFSIATIIQPEILIVDEILSVGDARFQRRSKERMLELMSGGCTVLFVSHSINQVRELCKRVVWLEKGKVRDIGEAGLICDQYENQMKKEV